MSVRHIAAVIDSDLPRSLRGIAIVYANSANDEDNAVALSAAKVAAGSGYGKRQAVTLIGELLSYVGSCGRPLLDEVPFDSLPDTAKARLVSIPRNRMPRTFLMHMGCKNCIPVGDVEKGSGVQSTTVRGAISDGLGVQSVASKPEDKPEQNQRAFKEMYAEFVLLFGTPVGDMRGRFGKAAKAAVAAGIEPGQLAAARRRYVEAWPRVACNPQALVNNWNRFGPEAHLLTVPKELRDAYRNA